MRRFACSVVLILLLALVAVPTEGRRLDTDSSTSHETLVLRLMIGTEPAQIGVKNGGLARIRVGNGPVFALAPVVHDGIWDASLVQISQDDAGVEHVRALGPSRRLEKGHVVTFEALGVMIDVELVDVLIDAGAPLTPLGPCATCCVVCGSVEMCACWVILDCGRCCCETACTCPQTSGTGQGVAMAGCSARKIGG